MGRGLKGSSRIPSFGLSASVSGTAAMPEHRLRAQRAITGLGALGERLNSGTVLLWGLENYFLGFMICVSGP